MNLACPHLRLSLMLAAGLLLAGCGGGGFGGPGFGAGVGIGSGSDPTGTVVAENDTTSFPSTLMHDFQLWPTGLPASGTNLLPFPLYPGDAVDVTEAFEDFYDADAYMSDGFFDYLEVWDGVYVSAGTDTVFFAY